MGPRARLAGPFLLAIVEAGVSGWLTSAQQQWLHGESDIGPDEYGKWLDAFVGGDRMIRWLYDFTGCLFGDRGCGDAVARCEHCGSAHDG